MFRGRDFFLQSIINKSGCNVLALQWRIQGSDYVMDVIVYQCSQCYLCYLLHFRPFRPFRPFATKSCAPTRPQRAHAPSADVAALPGLVAAAIASYITTQHSAYLSAPGCSVVLRTRETAVIYTTGRPHSIRVCCNSKKETGLHFEHQLLSEHIESLGRSLSQKSLKLERQPLLQSSDLLTIVVSDSLVHKEDGKGPDSHKNDDRGRHV